MNEAMGVVDIFGTDYFIYDQNEQENPKMRSADGLCEWYSHKLIVDIGNDKNKPDSFENLDEYWKQVLRHEAFHAIFHEIGLNQYANDETLIEVLAIIYPKVKKIMTDVQEIYEGV